MEKLAALEVRSKSGILENRRLNAKIWQRRGLKSLKFSCSSKWEVKSSYQNATTPSENFNSKISPSTFFKTEPFINGQSSSGPKWRSTKTNHNILDFYEDKYGGIIINSDKLPIDTNKFSLALRSSLSFWRIIGKKGVWLKLPLDRSDHVPIAVKEGFKYHHAEESYVMLTYWIPEGPNLLPRNASHQVGVGGFVINNQNEVLVVQEKYCDSASIGWKLPTGFIHESEEIFSGAVREVWEETGIETEFEEVIAFRHAHHMTFEKSDLFFICMLRPLSNEIKIDETEIQAAKWMPFADFVEQPLIKEDNMFRKIMEICIQRLRKSYCGLTAHQVVSKFDSRSSSLYYNMVDSTEDFNCPAE
ncbi:hypothetical protein LUZ60_016856 [Juncus effusus]|nr:hypothetical protein LUZ60_016856 [Juncus effusus]